MQPNTTDDQSQPPRGSDLPLQPVARQDSSTTDAQRDAAANVTRAQLDQIYQTGSPYAVVENRQQSQSAQATSESTRPLRLEPSAYDRTHSEQAAHAGFTPEHLQKYHSAWQDYYQKYYERYYTQAVNVTRAQIEKTVASNAGPNQPNGPIYGQAATSVSVSSGMNPTTAVQELQTEIRGRIAERAKKIKRSRHFWPLITALVVGFVFIFLQYNQLFIATVAAYVSPGSVDPQNIIVDPSADTKVSDDPVLVVPKINVEAPVIYGLPSIADDVVENNLRNGVVNYPIPGGGDSLPGQVGDTVILGHSSNDVFDPGQYKFVFVQLSKLNVGDTFYLNYKGTRYTYHVTLTKVISPTQIGDLTAKTDKPLATLVTCSPVGTSINRLIVQGEQVSPDPSTATASTSTASGSSPAAIGGGSSSVIQKIFGN